MKANKRPKNYQKWNSTDTGKPIRIVQIPAHIHLEDVTLVQERFGVSFEEAEKMIVQNLIQGSIGLAVAKFDDKAYLDTWTTVEGGQDYVSLESSIVYPKWAWDKS